MAKKAFSRISVKAATVTGAIVGFLCWLFVTPFISYAAVSMMVGGTLFHGYDISTLVLDVVAVGVVGALVAGLYNWALRFE